MAKKTKKKSESQDAEPLDVTETTAMPDDQMGPGDTPSPDDDGPDDAGFATDPAPDSSGITIKPSTPLAGEAELASRKGTWTYDGATPAGAARNAPQATVDAAADGIEDAAGVAADPPESDETPCAETAKDAALETAAPETGTASGTDTGETATPVAASVEDTKTSGAAAAAEPAPRSTERTFTPAQQVVVERKGGFVPMLLGGAVAALIGFGVADATQPGGLIGGSAPAEVDPFEAEARAALEATQTRIASLEAQASETGEVPGLADLESSVAALQSQIADYDADIAALVSGQSELDARLTELAQAPIAENVSEAAIAAYEQELAALQESIATQRAEIETLVDAAATREAEARALAEEARVQAAAAALIVQIETGNPFAAELDNYLAVGGAPVEAALSDLAGDGVPSLEGLQADFPDAARTALAAARDPSADTSDGAGGLGTYLARQLSARSVAPKEGDDPDAVLSRAEAAVRGGDLALALGEIETLPEAARAALADWEARATARRDAMAAATALTASANSN